MRAEVKTYLRRHQANRNSSSNIRRCKTCKHIRTTDIFQSTVTIQGTHNICKTGNFVYLIECRKCSKQYIGETENALYTHLSQWPQIRHLRPRRWKNQWLHSMEELIIMVIEKIWTEDTQLRRRESYWIHQLRSMELHLCTDLYKQ